ncbi:MAG: hypothetical protein EP329_08570 [Deltaproteobacteria bacterium]|nr:MAG: hypothetical protein EP329_08570 [Deltaproteobacteria bacterium]
MSRLAHSLPLAAALATASTLLVPAAPAAAAALPWRVAEEAVLYDGSARVTGAAVHFADGAPRVALMTVGNASPAMRLAVRDADGAWRVLPMPVAYLGSGTPEIAAVTPVRRPGDPWFSLAFDGRAFGDATELPAPPQGATQILPGVGPLRAVVYDADHGYRLATLGGGRSWRSVPIGSANAGPPTVLAHGDSVWAVVLEGLSLRARALTGSGGLRLSDVASFKAALDPRGRPSLVTVSGDAHTLTLVDGAHGFKKATLRLPRDVTAPQRSCLDAPCRVVTHDGQLEDVLALEGGAAAVYTLSTTVAQQKCEPFRGMMHPCDPAGPINTCPEPPEFTCTAPGVETRDPRLAWIAGGAVRDASLAPLLGWEVGPAKRDAVGDFAYRVLAATADATGAVHLVVRDRVERGSRVRWLRLVPAAAAPPTRRNAGSATPWTSTFDVVPQSDVQLALVGLNREEAAGTPRFGADGVETGGEGLGVLWSADLDGLDPRRAAVVTVDVTLPAEPLCGTPGLQLFHGDRGAAVHLAADGVTLVDRYKGTVVTLPKALNGRHRLVLQVGESGARVFVDDEPLASLELMRSAGPMANERLWIGQIARCVSPGAPLTWHRIAVGQGALAP